MSIDAYKEVVSKCRKDFSNYRDENSICTIIHAASWDDCIYRTFNEGLRLSWKYDLNKELPGSLIEYIHKNYILGSIVSLRKLYEKKQRKGREVISIPTLLDTIIENINLFTRYNYICGDGLHYSPSKMDDEKTWKENYETRGRHKMFDILSGNTQRDPNDLIKIEYLESLKKVSSLDKKIEGFANKYLLHSSDEINRGSYKDVHKDISIMKVQKEFSKVIMLIGSLRKILNEYFPAYPATPLFNPVENWSDSIFNKKIENKLYKYWYRRSHLWEKWDYKHNRDDNFYISERKLITT